MKKERDFVHSFREREYAYCKNAILFYCATNHGSQKDKRELKTCKKNMYNLRRGQYVNCKAIGDECSEEL